LKLSQNIIVAAIRNSIINSIALGIRPVVA